MYEHNAYGYWSGLTLCLTKVRSSRARCPATALIFYCRTSLQEFLREFIEKIYLGHVHLSVSNSINQATKGEGIAVLAYSRI